MPLLEVRHMVKQYFEPVKIEILKGVSFHLSAGELVALVGASGSGKSTLLNLIGALDRPTKGEIFFQGENLGSLRDEALAKFRQSKIGFVFQAHYLLPEFTSLENVCLPAWIAKGSETQAILKKGQELLERVGLGHRLQHRPHQLSGGEAQRVAVARALINSPLLLLADEPTGNLDRENREKLYRLLRQLNQERGITMVIATHDETISAHADRLLHLADGLLTH